MARPLPAGGKAAGHLLLVHGTTGDHSTWGSVLAGLQQHHTVWTLDRRGRGHSGDAANYSLEHESEDIAAVIDAIGSSVNLLDHSLAGFVRWKLHF